MYWRKCVNGVDIPISQIGSWKHSSCILYWVWPGGVVEWIEEHPLLMLRFVVRTPSKKIWHSEIDSTLVVFKYSCSFVFFLLNHLISLSTTYLDRATADLKPLAISKNKNHKPLDLVSVHFFCWLSIFSLWKRQSTKASPLHTKFLQTPSISVNLIRMYLDSMEQIYCMEK